MSEKRKGGCCGTIMGLAIVAIGGVFALLVLIMVFGRGGAPPASNTASSIPAPSPQPDPPTVTSRETLIVGDKVELELPGGKGVFLATTDDAYNEMLDAENANSKELMGRLIGAGKVFRVPNGTPATVVKTAVLSVFVRMEGADFGGQEGWTQRDFVRKP